MSKNRRVVKWDPDTDPEDVLWVCDSCGAELHADCIGETCPVCDEMAISTDWNEPNIKEPTK